MGYQKSKEKSIVMDKLTLGVCYYPEHWPEYLWEEDLERMLELGLEIIRIGEFAWDRFEPREGMFDFDFFDRFMDIVQKKNMKVILGTPTAAPPAWLTNKYPEVLNARMDGTLFRHGNRQHVSYNSSKYKELTTKIVEKLAEHYSNHPAVIGWQIDNEFNCGINVYYSEADHVAFREYMKEKFKDLKMLNEAMGTAFWSQTYFSWDEIYLTRPTSTDANNPHMVLEEKRFISQSIINYCKMQADIIKKYKRDDQFITTNGVFGHLDSHEMTQATLDFMCFDSYPNFAYDMFSDPKKPGNLNDRRTSWSLTRIRSISPHFAVAEQQSGAGGWDIRMKQPAPKPGQMRLWTMQSIAHGADLISYFRWRTCWVGTEIYWHGLNNYDNQPNRRLEELRNIRDDVQKISEIAGSEFISRVALIKDYNNIWDGEQDQWHGPLDEFSDDGWFRAAQLTHTPLDFLYMQHGTCPTELEDLKKYDLLIYSHATILTEEIAGLLKEYVGQGGTLIMGARTGYKDVFGRCPMRPMPGPASEICGVRVRDFTYLGPGDETEYAIWDGEKIEAPVCNDILEAEEGAQVLATFKGNYYDGLPALVVNSFGSGKAYYYGAGFSADTAETFLKKLGFASNYESIISIPREAELVVRQKDNQRYLIVLNYMPDQIEVEVKEKMLDLISNRQVQGKVVIKKYDVLVLKVSHR